MELHKEVSGKAVLAIFIVAIAVIWLAIGEMPATAKAWLMLGVFLGSWIAWFVYSNSKKWSAMIGLGGGFIVALLAVLVLTLPPMWYSDVTAEAAKAESTKDVVTNSSWDASVKQVDKWLRDNLNDPKSLEIVEWSKVVKTEDGSGYLVRCKYRAKNSFGAMVLENKIFALDKDGAVIYSEDWTGN